MTDEKTPTSRKKKDEAAEPVEAQPTPVEDAAEEAEPVAAAAEAPEPETADEPEAAEEPVAEAAADEPEPAEPAAEEPAAEAEEPPAEEPAAEAEEAAAEEAPAAEPAAEEAPAAAAPGTEEAPAEAAPAKKAKKRLPRALRHKHAKPKRERAAKRKPIARTPKPPSEPGRRQERRGVVVSDRGDKTIVVKVSVTKAHPKYKKVVRRTRKFHAHDEDNTAAVGDTVRIVETRPLSKLKHWRLAEIVERAR